MGKLDPKVVGARVRSARRDAGYSTQSALAEAAGVTDETISRIERGAYEPALSTLIALANALQVSLDSLAGTEQRENPRRLRPQLQRLVTLTESLDGESIELLTKVAERLTRPVPSAPDRGNRRSKRA